MIFKCLKDFINKRYIIDLCNTIFIYLSNYPMRNKKHVFLTKLITLKA